jgi:hypothetical protein
MLPSASRRGVSLLGTPVVGRSELENSGANAEEARYDPKETFEFEPTLIQVSTAGLRLFGSWRAVDPPHGHA